jgi:hypothetical protein
MRRICTATLVSTTPYSQSRRHETPKTDPKEPPAAWDERTWREHAHVDEKGRVYIPGMQFKKALDSAAGYLRIKVPSGGQSEFGRLFKAGVLVANNLLLPLKKKDLVPEAIWADSEGGKGGRGGKQVKRLYPTIQHWEGEVTFVVTDDRITNDIFERHLREAGQFIGIGRWRAENGGMYGRWRVVKIKWTKG